MHSLFFLVSAFMTVVSSESEMCSMDVHDYCKSSDKFPSDFPDTVDELKQCCNDIRDLASCHQNYIENCEKDDKNEAYFKYVQEKCQEDSEEFQIISKNLDCFSPTIKSLNGECSTGHIEEEDRKDLLTQSRNVFGENDLKCFEAMWLITCMSQSMGQRCGAELTDVSAGILENINFDYIHECNTENVSELSSFKEAIDRVFSEGKWLKNASDAEDK